ncbi:hypothetical protein AAY473_000050 [Plecturocebus cupreus]
MKGLTLFPRLECSGSITAHFSLKLMGLSKSPASASQAATTTAAYDAQACLPALGLENASAGRPASGATRPARGRKWERQRRRLGPSDEDAPGSEVHRPGRSDCAAARPRRKLPPLAGCRPLAAASWPPRTHGAGHPPRQRRLNPSPTGREAPGGAGCFSSPQPRSRSAAPSGSLPAPPSAPSLGCHQPRGGRAPTQASSAGLAWPTDRSGRSPVVEELKEVQHTQSPECRRREGKVNDNDVLNGSVPSK